MKGYLLILSHKLLKMMRRVAALLGILGSSGLHWKSMEAE